MVFGVCFFAYTNHFGLIPITKNLVKESEHLNFSALFRSHYFPIFLYNTISFAGYLSFALDTP